MGARELLSDLAGAGFTIEADGGDRLLIRPAAEALTDNCARRCVPPSPTCWRCAPNLNLERPDQADAAHARTGTKSRLFPIRGACEPVLAARDLAPPTPTIWQTAASARDAGRRTERSVWSAHYRSSRCGNHRRAGLCADLGRNLASLLQRCWRANLRSDAMATSKEAEAQKVPVKGGRKSQIGA